MQTKQPEQNPTQSQATRQPREKPAIIASRRHCKADGIGLSHYVLMDRKTGQ